MKISFHGADQDVTGSCHLVETGGSRILIDCGLFQGSRELNEENADAFRLRCRGDRCLLLTHAHLDHCGRMPLLASGVSGEIIATAASRELARLVMLDSAHLQESEVAERISGSRDSRRRSRRGCAALHHARCDECAAPLRAHR